jgi:hypothetical protein
MRIGADGKRRFAVFRQPASILPARIARIGVQIDF